MNIITITDYDGNVTRMQVGCDDYAVHTVAYFLRQENIKHVSMDKTGVPAELWDRDGAELQRVERYTKQFWSEFGNPRTQ